jgi:hypothetical protein
MAEEVVPLWLAGMGTTGTLITGMYLIAQERRDRKRKLISGFSVSLYINSEDSGLRMRLVNKGDEAVYDIEAYLITWARRTSGYTEDLACRLEAGQLGGRSCLECDVTPDIECIGTGRDAIATWLVTDGGERTWLKKRRSMYRSKGLLAAWEVRRHMDHVRKRYEETPWRINVDPLGRFTYLAPG